MRRKVLVRNGEVVSVCSSPCIEWIYEWEDVRVAALRR